MSTTSRNRNLLFIIAALLLTNIAVLAYFLWIKQPEAKHGPDKKNGMSDMLQKEVGFTDEQVAQYKQLKDQQWTTIKPMFDEMRKAKDSLFRLLSDPNANDSIINKATDAIAQKQKILDLQTFNHFKKVRALCTAEQQPKYDSMVQRMFRKMGKPQARRSDADKEEKK
ncbi:MAG: periplasmic heavy metal sensor [Bacteroidota bacterium]|nr:periplasmic heavy metal sensor [Bacteroidota bacterium]